MTNLYSRLNILMSGNLKKGEDIMFSQTIKNQNQPSHEFFYFAFIRAMIFIMLIFSFEVYSQDDIVPYQLSKRTGDEIDRQERDYFYLFPNIKDFEVAKAYELSNNSIKIEIQQTKLSGKPDTMQIITKPESKELANYFTDFEKIFNQYKVVQLHNINPELINLFVARQNFNLLLKKHKKREFDQFVVIDLDSSQFSGTVLYANDSLVVLWNDTSFYDWRKISEYLKIFHYSEIEKIIIEKDGSFLSGAGTGLLVGGGIGVFGGLIGGASSDSKIFTPGAQILFGGLFFGTTGALFGGIWGAAMGTDDEIVTNCNKERYINFSRDLQKMAVFHQYAPPEIFNTMKNKNKREFPQSAKEEKLKVVQPTKEFSNQKVEFSSTSISTNNKLHISFMASYTNTIANNDMIDAFTKSGFSGTYNGWLFGSVEYPADQSNILTWQIETSYDFYNNYRFGLGVKKIATQEVHGINNLSENAEGYTGNLFADWIVDPYQLNTLDRWEHMLGIGITYNKIKINRSTGYFNPEESVDENVYGLQLRGAIDYYPSSSLSFQFKLIVDIVQPIQLNLFKSDEVEDVLQQHSINFSGFDMSVGMRIHL
jgi:hypothetical protein